MLERLRRMHPGSSVPAILCFRLSQFACSVVLGTFFGLRVRGSKSIPADGPVLLVANHQSYLDPPAIGCRIKQRQPDFLARAGLWNSKALGWLITLMHSVPVAEQGSDATAIREILRRLQQGRCVLIFPEGSRTPDGDLQEFKRGVAVLVKRAKCPIVPTAIEGAYDAWPRHRGCPRLFRRVRVAFGDPIAHADLMADGAEAALARVEREVTSLWEGLRQDP